LDGIEFRYFFDPLCGWCYASAPALAALAEEYGDSVRMFPSGLFVQPRPISGIAEFAWRNDRRIGEMTGQVFSQAYHDSVLKAPDGVFTSAPLTLAFIALEEIDSRLAPRFLHAAQIARYVHGHDTSTVDEVARVAGMVATDLNIALNATDLAARLQSDSALVEKTQARIVEAQAELRSLGKNGVPQLMMRTGNRDHVFDGQVLYGGRDALFAAIRQNSN
jgi:putative protein-disulfide isomerase